MSLNLQALFRPAAVAVLGASPRADAMGTYVARNLRDGGYAGEIYPIHPTATEVEGMRCYPDLASLPRVPDCAVVALSADKVMGALRDAAAQGVKSAV
ncbi:CoA-binding protein [Variovorax sp.]|uniref:CoA-binding protein n=1 Tax=Variovorax sp. TaxID=1871043 RepID=UPI001383D158|nr:CoA-binding protein [Variovorax sp.]KAF1061505.1 MAG: Protein lysine acetyltransferase Pka [Variovorax sp.]